MKLFFRTFVKNNLPLMRMRKPSRSPLMHRQSALLLTIPLLFTTSLLEDDANRETASSATIRDQTRHRRWRASDCHDFDRRISRPPEWIRPVHTSVEQAIAR